MAVVQVGRELPGDFNKFWNNKFYYKVASCWLFLLIHTTTHGSMNVKKKAKLSDISANAQIQPAL